MLTFLIFLGVLFNLVIDLQFIILGIPDKYCLCSAGGMLCYSVVLK